MNTINWERWVKWSLVMCIGLITLWLVFNIYMAGQALWAFGVLTLVALAFFVYLSNIGFAYRYLFPGLAAMGIFVAFPLLYTAQIGFTNYSSNNLLSVERATDYLLEQTDSNEDQAMQFSLYDTGNDFRLLLTPPSADQEAVDTAPDANAASSSTTAATDRISYLSPALNLKESRGAVAISMTPVEAGQRPESSPLALADVLRHRDALRQLVLKLPDGTELRYAGVREFAPLKPVWQKNADGSLTQLETRTTYTPNFSTGFYENNAGERMQPGFKVNVGFANYERMLFDPDFRAPFIKIFIWTVIFSAMTVLTTTIVGMTLAVMLNWESLRFRTAYRTLLFLPYAVPSFISILVFRGLFNQNFGEINMVLDALFGMKPAWFADPFLAQVMILIANTWLGYPYIMILCTGLLKAVPSDLYEASAIAGASPWTNFIKITTPLIIKPLTPLLISVFAFNFNNFVLIALLTDGRPDFLNTKLPAGTTDILVSYTYRIAFRDSGQNFGLAAAISTVIFFLVAMLSLANMRLAKVNQAKA